jgi:hypothetical protein
MKTLLEHVDTYQNSEVQCITRNGANKAMLSPAECTIACIFLWTKLSRRDVQHTDLAAQLKNIKLCSTLMKSVKSNVGTEMAKNFLIIHRARPPKQLPENVTCAVTPK